MIYHLKRKKQKKSQKKETNKKKKKIIFHSSSLKYKETKNGKKFGKKNYFTKSSKHYH
jgi:FKBP-type peptidyl-prolyl cis-trans isomerase